MWKKLCTAHERWNHIIEGPGLSAQMTAGEALEALKKLLGTERVEINMLNNKFVDTIVADRTDQEFRVMMSESRLEQHISHDPELLQLSYRNKFFKSFYTDINDAFPYKDLTLLQIGIPLFDVVQVATPKGLFFVELSDDKHLYI